MDVGSVALEDPVGGDADEDEEIARRGAADTNLAFSGETRGHAAEPGLTPLRSVGQDPGDVR